MPSSVAGVVLAGGRSSRMGTSKALLKYKDKTLIEHMMFVLRQSGAEDVYISGSVEGFDCIEDNVPFVGPAAAIVLMMGHLKNYDGVLFVPVDMPFLNKDILSRLLLSGEQGTCFDDRPLPLYLPTSLVGHMKARENSSVRKMLANLDIAEIPVPEGAESNFRNFNTPEEWKEIEA